MHGIAGVRSYFGVAFWIVGKVIHWVMEFGLDFFDKVAFWMVLDLLYFT